VYLNDDKSIGLTHITLQCKLKNESERTIFFRAKRIHHSFMGKIRPEATVPDQLAMLPKGGAQQINMATIKDLEPVKIDDTRSPLSGRIELEIEYGASEDDLPYLLEYVADPTIGLMVNFDTKQIQSKIICPIRVHRHQQRRWR
jgi:hypothetical protein